MTNDKVICKFESTQMTGVSIRNGKFIHESEFTTHKGRSTHKDWSAHKCGSTHKDWSAHKCGTTYTGESTHVQCGAYQLFSNLKYLLKSLLK